MESIVLLRNFISGHIHLKIANILTDLTVLMFYGSWEEATGYFCCTRPIIFSLLIFTVFFIEQACASHIQCPTHGWKESQFAKKDNPREAVMFFSQCYCNLEKTNEEHIRYFLWKNPHGCQVLTDDNPEALLKTVIIIKKPTPADLSIFIINLCLSCLFSIASEPGVSQKTEDALWSNTSTYLWAVVHEFWKKTCLA